MSIVIMTMFDYDFMRNAFAAATLALFGYGLAAQILENFHVLLLPMLVPNLHFHLYLNLLELLASRGVDCRVLCTGVLDY